MNTNTHMSETAPFIVHATINVLLIYVVNVHKNLLVSFPTKKIIEGFNCHSKANYLKRKIIPLFRV